MLRKVKLYGELAKFVGHKEFEVKVDSIGRAVSFLINNFPGIEKYMSPKYYQVKVGNYEVGEDELHYPIGQKEDIHFIPVISGAGRGIGKILLGAVLIGAAFFIVKQQSAAVIERFGKFQSIRQSGLQLRIPIVDSIAGRLSLKIQQLDVIVETKTKDDFFHNNSYI